MKQSAPVTADKISIVVPAYNEASTIDTFLSRLIPVLESLDVGANEVIFVDDGSTDETWPIIQASIAGRSNIRALGLSRNFGKEAALSAGLDQASGDAVVLIDADLQDPPELIAEFVKLWRAGYQNVYGLRTNRSRESWPKRWSAALFYRVFNWFGDTRIPPNAGDFRLLGPEVVKALRRCGERRRFMKGLYAWAGYPSVAVHYERAPRTAGRSGFGASKLLGLAMDGIFSHSTAPLRACGWLGLTCALAAAGVGTAVLFEYFATAREAPSGFYLTALVILGFAALNFLTLGIMGEYLGRIYSEVKGRPLYLIREDDAASGEQDRAAGDG